MVKVVGNHGNFHKTNVGSIPKDWEIKRVGDISQIFGRIGFRGYTIKDIVQEGKGAISISPSNIKNNKMDFSKCTYISWNKYEESPEIKIFNGDIILVKTGSTIGKTSIVQELSWKATLNPQLIVLKKIKIDNYFLSYMMGYKTLQSQIISAIVGGAIPTLSQELVSNFILPIPPTKAEQSAIATVLAETDTLISSLEKLIAKKRNIKKGTMQKLLQPKDGWVLKSLGDVATLKARIGWQGLTTAEYKNTGDYYLITGTEFKNGFIDWDNCVFITEKRYKQDINIQVKNRDVLVTKDGTIGKVAFIKSVPKPATLNSGVFVIRPKDNSFNPEFFYYVLLSEQFIIFLSQLIAGSTINHLYQKDFVSFKFWVPNSLQEQASIAEILANMDEEISVLESKLEKYKSIKQGMMQNLLTGKIRLI
jgi:type I restriction enzyme S subunit